jgi:hypothetical protein
MENFYFGVENLCEIKFHSTEEDNERFEWFADYDKVLLKNGFGIDEIIVESKEIYNTTDIPKYFELIYENKSRYFTKLRLSTYMMNKFSLGKHFQPVSELIRDNKNFFFLIDCGDYLKLKDIVLSETILKAIKDGICKVVLNTSYEPYSNEQIGFIQLVKIFAEKYGLRYGTLKIISGNLIVRNNLDSPYEFVPYCYFLEHPWFIVKDAFFGEKYYSEKISELEQKHIDNKKNFIDINRNIKSFEKKVLCYNRRPHAHRKYFFYYLFHDKNIWDNSYVSLNNKNVGKTVPYRYDFLVSEEEHNRLNNFFKENQISWVFDGNNLDVNLAMEFDATFHKKTFVSLVSETSVNPNVVFFSEKIFKPIFACQPFIISGNRGSLHHLKKMGFKTFDRWWDESYDLEHTFPDRVRKMLNVVTEIINKSDEELVVMLQEMEETLSHNFDVFMNAKNEQLYKVFNHLKF